MDAIVIIDNISMLLSMHNTPRTPCFSWLPGLLFVKRSVQNIVSGTI